jgi:hypothetical protein
LLSVCRALKILKGVVVARVSKQRDKMDRDLEEDKKSIFDLYVGNDWGLFNAWGLRLLNQYLITFIHKEGFKIVKNRVKLL